MSYFTTIILVYLITRITFVLKEYFSDPILVLGFSCNLKTSSFYTGKGKGKAIDPPSPAKSKSSAESDLDSDLEYDIRRAKILSLETNDSPKAGPSKMKGDIDFPVEPYDVGNLTKYTSDWKILSDMHLKKQKLFNKLKIRAEKQPLSEEENKLLLSYKNDCNELRIKKNKLEVMLSQQGVNPWEQFINKTSSEGESSSEAESSYSFYSSDSSQLSSNSNSRSKKRVKYSDAGDNTDFSLGLVVLNIAPVIRLFLCLFSAMFLLVLDFNIFPILNLVFINIDLTQLLFLFLIVNITKLIYRAYSMFITLYNHYLNKDYMAIYFNVYYSIVVILLYLTSNSDINILYF